jgi:hypothetical protein
MSQLCTSSWRLRLRDTCTHPNLKAQILPFIFRHEAPLHSAPKIVFRVHAALLAVLTRWVLRADAFQIRGHEVLTFGIVVEWEAAAFWGRRSGVGGAAAWSTETGHLGGGGGRAIERVVCRWEE